MTTRTQETWGHVVCSLSPNWWLFALRGILALIFSVLAFLLPVQALFAFSLVFGAFSLVDGAFGLVSAFRRMRKGSRWGWLAFSGILGILVGVVVLLSPFVATIVLATFLWANIAIWSAFSGVLEIAAAIRLRREIKGEFWLVLNGILSIIFATVILWLLLTRPIETVIALGWLMGVYALLSGFVLIFLGLKLRKAERALSLQHV